MTPVRQPRSPSAATFSPKGPRSSSTIPRSGRNRSVPRSSALEPTRISSSSTPPWKPAMEPMPSPSSPSGTCSRISTSRRSTTACSNPPSSSMDATSSRTPSSRRSASVSSPSASPRKESRNFSAVRGAYQFIIGRGFRGRFQNSLKVILTRFPRKPRLGKAPCTSLMTLRGRPNRRIPMEASTQSPLRSTSTSGQGDGGADRNR